MDGQVTPRSIAYAAVLVCLQSRFLFHHILSLSSPTQLAFNLTDAAYWMEVYNNFNFRALYALIVDFFEVSCGAAAQKRSKNLLKWWSTYVIELKSVSMNLTDHLTFSTDKYSPTIMV